MGLLTNLWHDKNFTEGEKKASVHKLLNLWQSSGTTFSATDYLYDLSTNAVLFCEMNDQSSNN